MKRCFPDEFCEGSRVYITEVDAFSVAVASVVKYGVYSVKHHYRSASYRCNSVSHLIHRELCLTLLKQCIFSITAIASLCFVLLSIKHCCNWGSPTRVLYLKA